MTGDITRFQHEVPFPPPPTPKLVRTHETVLVCSEFDPVKLYACGSVPAPDSTSVSVLAIHDGTAATPKTVRTHETGNIGPDRDDGIEILSKLLRHFKEATVSQLRSAFMSQQLTHDQSAPTGFRVTEHMPDAGAKLRHANTELDRFAARIVALEQELAQFRALHAEDRAHDRTGPDDPVHRRAHDVIGDVLNGRIAAPVRKMLRDAVDQADAAPAPIPDGCNKPSPWPVGRGPLGGAAQRIGFYSP